VVLRVRAVGPGGQWSATVSPAAPWPMAAGRAISTLSLLVLAGVAAAMLRRRRRRRGHRAHADTPAAPSHEAVAALVK
jgi:hypothetical protein